MITHPLLGMFWQKKSLFLWPENPTLSNVGINILYIHIQLFYYHGNLSNIAINGTLFLLNVRWIFRQIFIAMVIKHGNAKRPRSFKCTPLTAGFGFDGPIHPWNSHWIFLRCIYSIDIYLLYIICIYIYYTVYLCTIAQYFIVYIYIRNLMWQFEQVSKPIMIYLVWIGSTRHFGVPVTASITSVSTGRCFPGQWGPKGSPQFDIM